MQLRCKVSERMEINKLNKLFLKFFISVPKFGAGDVVILQRSLCATRKTKLVLYWAVHRGRL